MDAGHVQGIVETRLRNAPTVGQPAPTLLVTDAASLQPVRLSTIYPRKPVVLYFASYSCLCSQQTAEPVVKLSKKFGDRFQFLLVYIREAHPTNGYQTKSAGKQFSIPDSNRLPDRIASGLRFAREKAIPFPVLVDPIDDRNAVRWGAWPARLFVIDQKGTVVYAGQQGPWFVKPTKDFDLGLPGVPEFIRDLPGYSRESLEEFLEGFSP